MRKHHLEDRGTAAIALPCQIASHPGKWIIRVAESAEQVVAGARQEGEKRWRILDREAGSQHDRVDHVAEGMAVLLVISTCGRGADAELLLSAEPMQEHLEGGQQHGIQGGIAAASQSAKPLKLLGSEHAPVAGTNKTLPGRARLVSGKVKHMGHPCQRLPPIAAQCFALVLESAKTSVDMARESALQGEQGIRALFRTQQSQELVDQQPHRPAVDGDVMETEQQNVGCGADAQQVGAQGRFPFEIKRV